jgi:hypothetical protein
VTVAATVIGAVAAVASLYTLWYARKTVTDATAAHTELMAAQRQAGQRLLTAHRETMPAAEQGIVLGATEGELPVTAAMGREQARLCILAGADPDELTPWIETGRRRATTARPPPFSGAPREQHD